VNNTATGYGALYANTTGYQNTAYGQSALGNNTIGYGNTAEGVQALHSNTAGISNVAIGGSALQNTTGSGNVGLGVSAGFNLTSGNNNVAIANMGVAGESSTIRIGAAGFQTRAFVAGVSGVAVSGAAVVVNGSGQLGVTASSQRFKTAIKPMDKASEAILSLKPVTFHYKTDNTNTPQFGLIAEEVAQVNPDLIVRDEKGEIYTVRYEAVNAMLLNEFLKEHRTVQDLKSTAAKQEATIAQQQKKFEAKIAHQQQQIETLTAGLQRVSAQLEASKPAPQVVNNP
jgi:hypothetical protein